jgi:hypothetical protein
LSGPTVIPITPSLPDQGRGAPGTGYVININGGLATSAEIGKMVVNSIRQFNLLNGPANISVA